MGRWDIPFSGESGLAGQLRPVPPKVQLRFDIKMDAKGLVPLLEKLNQLLRRPEVFRMALRRAIAASFLRLLRERYLQSLTRGLEMHTLYENGYKREDSPRRRMREHKLRTEVSDLYDRLNEEQLNGHEHAAARTQARIGEAHGQLVDQLGRDARGNKMASHSLSALRGAGTMRQLALDLLNAMTNVAELSVTQRDDAILAGIGDEETLAQFETPSATAPLTGHATTSPFTSLWRHLEFGTGAYRKKAGNSAANRQGNAASFGDDIAAGSVPSGAWFYGKVRAKGLLLQGTRPMDFLRDAGGQAYAGDWAAFQVAFGQEMQRIMTL